MSLTRDPLGREIPAPSRMAWARSKSSASAASAAALRAFQISTLPSKAGAVSQNSSLLDLSCPSVRGMSDFHRIFSCLRGLFFVVVPPKRPEDVESLNAEGLRLPRPLLPRWVPIHPPISWKIFGTPQYLWIMVRVTFSF